MQALRLAYYAHCLAIYDTPQEERDIKTLEALGFEVVNPNTEENDQRVKELKALNMEYMLFFKGIISGCDVLAFRSLPDGRIPSGVGLEIQYAREMGKPVIELPSQVEQRRIDKELTREFLLEVGYR